MVDWDFPKVDELQHPLLARYGNLSILDALRQARADVLEEAAKVAETAQTLPSAAAYIAAAIRALIPEK